MSDESKAGADPPKTAAFRRQLAVDDLVDGPWEKRDWPEGMPKPPPYPADDEGRAEPGAEDE